jgi:HEAT repeat protein
MNSLTEQQIVTALADSSPEVRRTALEVSVAMQSLDISQLLDDNDVFVAEMAAWCLGERTSPTDHEIQALITTTLHHAEPVVREASAAALGSLGDERGLPAILTACTDKPAVRRRAILALAPFEGDDVDAALQTALEDRDWQVRQNAEILLNPRD